MSGQGLDQSRSRGTGADQSRSCIYPFTYHTPHDRVFARCVAAVLGRPMCVYDLELILVGRESLAGFAAALTVENSKCRERIVDPDVRLVSTTRHPIAIHVKLNVKCFRVILARLIRVTHSRGCGIQTLRTTMEDARKELDKARKYSEGKESKTSTFSSTATSHVPSSG